MYDTQSFCTGSSQFSAGVGSSKDCKAGLWEDWAVCFSLLCSTSSVSVDKGATPQVHEGALWSLTWSRTGAGSVSALSFPVLNPGLS